MKMPALVELKTAAPSFDRCAEIARVVPLQEGCELVITDTMIRLIAQNGAEFTFYRGDCARAVTEGMFTCLMALRAAPAPHYVEMGRKGDKVNTHKVIGIDTVRSSRLRMTANCATPSRRTCLVSMSCSPLMAGNFPTTTPITRPLTRQKSRPICWHRF